MEIRSVLIASIDHFDLVSYALKLNNARIMSASDALDDSNSISMMPMFVECSSVVDRVAANQFGNNCV